MERNTSPSLNRSPSAESEDQMNRNDMSWKDTLLDNLLLFSATPKGTLIYKKKLKYNFVLIRYISFNSNWLFT